MTSENSISPVRHEPPDRSVIDPGTVPTFPTPGEFAAMVKLADQIADTEFVPSSLRKRPAAVLACIMAGREMGVGPMQALQKIHVIAGRPAPSAELMRSMVLTRGHVLRVEEYTSERVTVVGRRRNDSQEMRVTFGVEDARRAGLLAKDGGMYSKYPKSMFLARATSELCRALFPDVLAGFSYTPEEVSVMPPDESETVVISDPAMVEDVEAEQDRLNQPSVQPPVKTVASRAPATPDAAIVRIKHIAAVRSISNLWLDEEIRKCISEGAPDLQMKALAALAQRIKSGDDSASGAE